ncbi:646d643f-b689-4241-a7fe-8e331dc93673 [Thermothielavioides terrestris]|jgi:hypothetical protein|uniref:SnoaL-like domain-containing protein n=2 Tax=Thermothielavioides terrestris TaxID=2587410 RepID=G2QVB5_THETT|nr:uncharacterized protein THITE_2085313 [Thermothielavioides terrestris NRRL 8126]AEO63802.1 hypothetical protein THITE_2085313 [Thermothielavioides terrestris NRRL 8126]SPQ23472.1 646d643f-b689-4241-a7fe-8e331dc93673 [Thermothielavioides terrestris]
MDPLSLHRARTRSRILNLFFCASADRNVPLLRYGLASDFRYDVAPPCSNKPSLDRDGFTRRLNRFFEAFSTFRLIGETVYQDHDRGVIIAITRIEGTLRQPFEGSREWRSDSVMVVKFNDNGTRITAIREFVDAARVDKLVLKAGGDDGNRYSEDDSEDDSDGHSDDDNDGDDHHGTLLGGNRGVASGWAGKAAWALAYTFLAAGASVLVAERVLKAWLVAQIRLNFKDFGF